MQEARRAQGDAVQDGQGEPLRARCVFVKTLFAMGAAIVRQGVTRARDARAPKANYVGDENLRTNRVRCFGLVQGSVVTTASSLVTVVKPSPCSTRRRRRRRRLCCAFNAARASKCTCTRSSVARRSKSVVTRRRIRKCLDWFARKMFRPSTRRRAAAPCLEQMIDVFVLFSRARSTSNY